MIIIEESNKSLIAPETEKTNPTPTTSTKKKKNKQKLLTKQQKEKQTLIKLSFQNKKQFEKLCFEWQQKLFEPSSIDTLIEAGKYLTPKHYTEVLIERQVSGGYCGYPICSRSVDFRNRNRKLTLLKNELVYHLHHWSLDDHEDSLQLTQMDSNKPDSIMNDDDREEEESQQQKEDDQEKDPFSLEVKRENNSRFYCSSSCHIASEYYISQLSVDPIYLRNLQKASNIDVLNLKPSEMTHLANSFGVLVIREKEPTTKTSFSTAATLSSVSFSSKSLTSQYISQSKDNPIITENSHMIVEGYVLPNQNVKNITFYEKSSTINRNLTKDSRKIPNKEREEQKLKSEHSDQVEGKIARLDSKSKSSSSTSITTMVKPLLSEEEEEESENENWLRPSKKRSIPPISFFGNFWILLDKLITPETKALLKKDLSFFDVLNVHDVFGNKRQEDSVTAERRKIFSEKIIKDMAMIKQDLGIATPLEDCLLVLMKTFTLDVKSTMLNALEVYGLCVVLLRILSNKLTALKNELNSCVNSMGNQEESSREDFKTTKFWNELMKPLGMTDIELTIFTDIFY